MIAEQSPVSQPVLDKQALDAAETKRIRSLDKRGLEGEIRRQMRLKKVNHLTTCMGTLLLVALGVPIDRGNDPYCLKWSGTRPKMSRMKKKAEVKK